MAFSVHTFIILLITLFTIIISNNYVESITFFKQSDFNIFGQANTYKYSIYQFADQLAAKENHAKNGQFPWMVAIHVYRWNDDNWFYHVCGGSIISNRWVLTAGHCIDNAKEIMVIFGDVNREHAGYHSYQGPGFAMMAVEGIIHPDHYVNINDIGLLYMPMEIPFGLTIQPIKLAGYRDVYKSYNGKQALILGWGGDGISKTRHNTLQYGFLPIIPSDHCYENEYTHPGIMCTAANTGVDACQGDSGSPLLIYSGLYNQFIQVGIVSAGHDADCPSSKPGMYTRVDYYNEWIYKITGILF